MMLRLVLPQRQSFFKGSSHLKFLVACQSLFHSSSCKSSSALEEVKTKPRSLQPEPHQPKMKMEPYVKNLFIGKIDPEVFTFPEFDQGALNIVEEMTSEVEKFMNSLQTSPFTANEKVSENLVQKLQELGLFKLNIPQQYGGLELTCSEMLRLAEVFGKDLSLFHTLNVHLHYVSNLLSTFGSDEQKEKYLPSLASGDLKIGFALWEKDAGIDVSKLDCSASFLGDSYLLSGTKQWVCNGGFADKFIVFARERKGNFKDGADSVTCFLVDKHAPGITAKSLDTVGLHGYNAWEVNFDKTPVPKENVIAGSGQGLHILKSILHGNFTLAGAYTGLLRDLLNTTVHHAINRETFGKPLIEYDIVKEHLAEAALRIYSLESIAYMTAHFYDDFEDPDCEVEAAIVKLYSSETLMWVVQKCFSILGSDTYLKDKPYERILRDALFSPLVETSVDSLRMSVALRCVQHVGYGYQERVLERRNPLFYPQKALKRFYKTTFNMMDEHEDRGIIYQNVHPSLELSAAYLEKSILKLQEITEDTFVKWGAELDDKQMNLARLADIAIDLYISTAVIARTSRAISIGLRNCDTDGNLANSIVYNASERINQNVKLLTDSPFANNDANYCRIVNTMVHEKKYFAAHPLARNF